MSRAHAGRAHAALIWAVLVIAIGVPIVLAANSPQLAWRSPVYIAAGFAGVIAMGLLLMQPLLASGVLPGFPSVHGRRVHRMVGSVLVLAIVVHVGALWMTSPPDVIDALVFDSPTPFSAWGVVAMWAVFASALLAALRRRLRLRPRTWRIGHTALAVIIVVGSVVHAMLIEGTMETISKAVLCGFVLIAAAKIVFDLYVWLVRVRPKT